MFQRKFEPLVRDRLKTYPAVALLGPRQCGKTTLARSLGGAYYDLEQEPERLRLDLEWDRLVAGKKPHWCTLLCIIIPLTEEKHARRQPGQDPDCRRGKRLR